MPPAQAGTYQFFGCLKVAKQVLAPLFHVTETNSHPFFPSSLYFPSVHSLVVLYCQVAILAPVVGVRREQR